MKKIVLITGATSGIGLACARKFAENGDRLILTGRNENRLADIKKELTEKGCNVLTLSFDVRDSEKAAKYIEMLPEEWQEIDVLVNNAGLALGLEPEYEGKLDDCNAIGDISSTWALLLAMQPTQEAMCIVQQKLLSKPFLTACALMSQIQLYE